MLIKNAQRRIISFPPQRNKEQNSYCMSHKILDLVTCCCRPCPPLEEAAAVKVICMAVHEITEVHLTVQEVKLGSLSKFFGSLYHAYLISIPVSPCLTRWLWHRGRPCKSLRPSRLPTVLDIIGSLVEWTGCTSMSQGVVCLVDAWAGIRRRPSIWRWGKCLKLFSAVETR